MTRQDDRAGGHRGPRGSLRVFRLVGLAFVILGVVLGVLFAVLAVRQSVISETRPTVEGTVVGNDERRGRDSDRGRGSRQTLFYPVIDYVVDGTTHTLTARSGSNPAKYSVGDTVTISYDPDNPIDAEIAGSHLVLFIVLALAFTVGIGGMGAVLLIIGVRNLKNERRAGFEGSGGPYAGPPAFAGAGEVRGGAPRRPGNGPPMIVPIILIAVGVAVTAIVGVIALRGQQFEDRAIRVTGVVTAMENDQGSFRPVVTYTLDGKERTFTASVASNPPAYEIGEKVQVLIDPVNRWDVKIQGQGTVVGVVFLSIGVAVFLAGIVVLVIAIRRRTSSPMSR